MGYRDELGAAHAKIEVLEEQLRALREEKEREEEAKRPRTERSRRRRPGGAPLRSSA